MRVKVDLCSPICPPDHPPSSFLSDNPEPREVPFILGRYGHRRGFGIASIPPRLWPRLSASNSFLGGDVSRDGSLMIFHNPPIFVSRSRERVYVLCVCYLGATGKMLFGRIAGSIEFAGSRDLPF